MMGLLWYKHPDEKETWAEAIAAAAGRHYARLGVRPDTAFLNPADYAALNGEREQIAGLEIESSATVLHNHVYVICKNGSERHQIESAENLADRTPSLVAPALEQIYTGGPRP